LNDRLHPFVEHFDRIHRERMRDLPIVNERLAVEMIGLDSFGEHQLGVLLTPWFMNLLLIPGQAIQEEVAGESGEVPWTEREQGSRVSVDLPCGPVEFLVTHDEELGTYLTAVLLSNVLEFADQETARDNALEMLRRLREPPAARSSGRRVSRRGLFARLGTG
jgi:[NiFe] hydrogenase assembly HybE family chaperone